MLGKLRNFMTITFWLVTLHANMSIVQQKQVNKIIIVWQRNWPDVRIAYCPSVCACVRGCSVRHLMLTVIPPPNDSLVRLAPIYQWELYKDIGLS